MVPTVGLEKLGYDEGQIDEHPDYIDENDTIEGAPHLERSTSGVRLCVQAGRRNRALRGRRTSG